MFLINDHIVKLLLTVWVSDGYALSPLSFELFGGNFLLTRGYGESVTEYSCATTMFISTTH